MITFILSVLSKGVAVLTGTLFGLLTPFSFLFPHPLVPTEETTATTTVATTATTTTTTTTITTVATTATSTIPAVHIVVPKAPASPATHPSVPVPSVVSPPPPLATSTPSVPIGTTTLAVALVPLLSGGVAHGGESVPIAYLQVMNIGSQSAQLEGFTLTQYGSAPDAAVIGLTSIDDKGVTRGFVGGVEGKTPFEHGVAVVPAVALFEPGQMRLFTIKATLTKSSTVYAETQLRIQVTAVESTANDKGQFPIPGTTWTIAQ